MKPSVKERLLIVLPLLFILLFFYFIQVLYSSSSQSRVVNAVVSELPVRLRIPAINVNAHIQYVGVTSAGGMDVPSTPADVGWFKLGSRPGEMGSAVISGHLDGENGEAGVFTNLHKLKKGDKLHIEDSKGKSIAFVVRDSRIYDPGYADEVFSRNDGIYLNLVTCDGVWDGSKKSYSKRLVVFADIMH